MHDSDIFLILHTLVPIRHPSRETDAMSDYASSSSRPVSPIDDLPALPNTTPRPYRFTWDAPHKKGPASVSDTTDGRGDFLGAGAMVGPYGEVHTPSSANLALAGMQALGGAGADWTSSVHGFHGA